MNMTSGFFRGRFPLMAVIMLVGAAVASRGMPEPPPPHHPPHPDEGEVLEFLERNLPETRRDLLALREQEPVAYQHQIFELGHLVRRYQELVRVDPEVAGKLLEAHRLERESHALAERIRAKQGEKEREALKSELRRTLTEIFELRLAERELELKHFERELDHIRTLLEKRKKARNEIIERRLRDLAHEHDEALGWW